MLLCNALGTPIDCKYIELGDVAGREGEGEMQENKRRGRMGGEGKDGRGGEGSSLRRDTCGLYVLIQPTL